MGILFNSTALGIHFCETSLIFNFKTRLGGEICLCDVNMHKGYFLSRWIVTWAIFTQSPLFQRIIVKYCDVLFAFKKYCLIKWLFFVLPIKSLVVYYFEKGLRKIWLESKWKTIFCVVLVENFWELRNVWKDSTVFPVGMFHTEIRGPLLQRHLLYEFLKRLSRSFCSKWNWSVEMVNVIP